MRTLTKQYSHLFKLRIKSVSLHNLKYPRFVFTHSFSFSRLHNSGSKQEQSEEQEEEDNFNFDFMDKSVVSDDSLIDDDFHSIMAQMKCKGCGVHLQTNNKDKIGFVPKTKVQSYLAGQSSMLPGNNLSERIQLTEFEQVADEK